MAETNLNESIINAILKSIPKNIKPVIYLMELLELSRESVYRRIRQEIPFSIGELTKLSLTLGFSLDEIVEGSKKERMYFDLLPSSVGRSNTYLLMFQGYHNSLRNLLTAQKSTMLMALNHVPPLFSIFYDQLFKFSYYKWMNENLDEMPKSSFSNLIIPQEILTLQEKIKTGIQEVNNTVLILSPHVCLGLIKDIQYFYQRKLIDKEELQLLKEDVLNFIDFMEKIARTGFYNASARVDIYLSMLFIYSNSIYLKYDEIVETHYWVYSSNPMNIRNSAICEMQKKWFLSLKKHSTLITQSNEILQTEFFDTQREYTNKFLVENPNSSFFKI